MENHKITLFLMTGKGYAFLNFIIKRFGAATIDKVIVSADKNLHADYYTEIKTACLDNEIPVFDRKSHVQIDTLYSIAVSWRWIISLSENLKLIVFHDSVLPRYRGFAPLVNALINGEYEIGVTALYACEEYDKGEIIGQASTKISYPVKIEEAININNENYLKLAEKVIGAILKKNILVATPQDESAATYSLWRDEDDYLVDWRKSSQEILRFIHAVGYPYKGAKCCLNGVQARILDGELVDDVFIENRDAGKVIFVRQGFPVVVCGTGLLIITELTDEEQNNLLPLKNFRIRF